MRRTGRCLVVAALGLVLVAACGTATPSVVDDETTTSATSTSIGGATWQDVPTSSDESTRGGSASTAADSGGPGATTGESSDGSTGMRDDTSDDATSSSGGLDPPSTSDSSSESGVPQNCDDLQCAACAMCAVEAGGECAQIADACMAFDGCESAATCLVTCGVTGLCLDDCCDGVPPFAVMAAQQVDQCVAEACEPACNGWSAADCN